MTRIALVLLSALCLGACSPSDPDRSARSDIIIWASQIGVIESRLVLEIDRAAPLIDRVTDRPPTVSDLSQLSDYGNRMTSLYNDMAAITPPRDARQAQDLYVENYSLIEESARYYVLAIRLNNVDYFNRSAEAAAGANQVGSQAYFAFQDLLDQYSIVCSEINYCE